jgi:hypothetical protein
MAKSAGWARQLHQVIATREGLVGKTTAARHRIAAADVFVALPSRAALFRCVSLIVGQELITAPVLDVGPWFTDDPYWTRAKPVPKAEGMIGQTVGQYRCNGAGIDLSDGLLQMLGVKPAEWPNSRVLWWFV